MTQASGRHAYFLQPEHTYRERQCLGVIGLPRKIHDTSGIAMFVLELVSCIWPSALALFPPCRVFSVVLGSQAQHTLGFRLNQLMWEAGDPCQPEQSKSSGEGM